MLPGMTVYELYLIKDTNFIQTELLSLPGFSGERRKQEAHKALRDQEGEGGQCRVQSTEHSDGGWGSLGPGHGEGWALLRDGSCCRRFKVVFTEEIQLGLPCRNNF